MHLSVATATFYFLPFAEAVETIAKAGFEYIELDLYWERKSWAMAQHLKGISAREAVRCIAQAGLRVSSIHDGGGVLEDPRGIQGYISPAVWAYLDELGYSPDCLVFHTPHIEGQPDRGWWEHISPQIVQALAEYRRAGAAVTIENMPPLEGYTVAITTPQALNEYARSHALGVTLDTTHCALAGVDIVTAAQICRDTVRTIHLSDYLPGAAHVFIGAGSLDFARFFQALDLTRLRAITLECSLAARGQLERDMTQAERVEQLKLARERVGKLLPVNQNDYAIIE